VKVIYCLDYAMYYIFIIIIICNYEIDLISRTCKIFEVLNPFEVSYIFIRPCPRHFSSNEKAYHDAGGPGRFFSG